MGLDSGSTGRAEVEAFGGWGASGPTPYEQACQLGWKLDSGDGYDKSMSKQDYMAGCIYGLNHQDAEWTRGRERPR